MNLSRKISGPDSLNSEGFMDEIEELDSEFAVRVRDAGSFDDTSFVSKDIGNGIRIVLGKLKESENDSLVPQSIKFQKPEWDLAKVQAWVSDHQDQFMPKETNLKKLSGIEVFSAGKWNGDEYSVSDLDAMVEAFKTFKDTMRPYLKLGHNEEQKLLAKDGLPAAGWVGDLRRVGNKLIADFVDIPAKVFQLITNKSFRKVSAEIIWNMKDGKATFPRVLSGVALLGSDMPAVSNLNDILNLFTCTNESKSYSNDQIHCYSFEMENKMSEENQKVESPEVLKHYESKLAEMNKELEALRTYKKESTDELATMKAKLEASEIEAQVAGLESANLITKSMKPYIAELLSEKKEYSVSEKKLSKFELISELLKLYQAAEFPTTEKTEAKEETKVNDLEAHRAKIEQYAKDHKCSYAQAYRALGDPLAKVLA